MMLLQYMKISLLIQQGIRVEIFKYLDVVFKYFRIIFGVEFTGMRGFETHPDLGLRVGAEIPGNL